MGPQFRPSRIILHRLQLQAKSQASGGIWRVRGTASGRRLAAPPLLPPGFPLLERDRGRDEIDVLEYFTVCPEWYRSALIPPSVSNVLLDNGHTYQS